MLYNIKLNDGYKPLIEDKGFCFASFVDDASLARIFISPSIASKLKEGLTGNDFWAEVKETDKGFRASKIWSSLEQVIADSHPKLKEVAIQFKGIDELRTQLGFRKKKDDQSLSFMYREGLVGRLSDEKNRQLEERISKLKEPSKYKRHETKVYTFSEYALERWAEHHGFNFYDYNVENQFAPQDCRIDVHDIDVKSVVGIGRRQGFAYSSVGEAGETIVGVHSHTSTLADDLVKYTIDGVFSPDYYGGISSKLHFFDLAANNLNVCYFMPLADYFKPAQFLIDTHTDDVIDHIIKSNLFGYFLLSASVSKRQKLLSKYITNDNRGFADVILDLLKHNKLPLLPHYLADFLVGCMYDKKIIDAENIRTLVYSIFMPTERQKKFIDDLIKGCESIAKVRCHWHPDEDIKSMGIDIYKGHIPTLRAICSHNKKSKTTFFTYSWKTSNTLVYESDKDICTDSNCGCLVHTYIDKYAGSVLIGKQSCQKHGKKQYDSLVLSAKSGFQGSPVKYKLPVKAALDLELMKEANYWALLEMGTQNDDSSELVNLSNGSVEAHASHSLAKPVLTNSTQNSVIVDGIELFDGLSGQSTGDLETLLTTLNSTVNLLSNEISARQMKLVEDSSWFESKNYISGEKVSKTFMSKGSSLKDPKDIIVTNYGRVFCAGVLVVPKLNDMGVLGTWYPCVGWRTHNGGIGYRVRFQFSVLSSIAQEYKEPRILYEIKNPALYSQLKAEWVV